MHSATSSPLPSSTSSTLFLSLPGRFPQVRKKGGITHSREHAHPHTHTHGYVPSSTESQPKPPPPPPSTRLPPTRLRPRNSEAAAEATSPPTTSQSEPPRRRQTYGAARPAALACTALSTTGLSTPPKTARSAWHSRPNPDGGGGAGGFSVGGGPVGRAEHAQSSFAAPRGPRRRCRAAP